MRLDKFLSNTLNYSRSEIKKQIKYGKVSVNNEIIRDASFSVDDNDDIFFNNEKVNYQKFTYIVLNKPKGYVSATRDNHDKTVLDILGDEYKKMELFPVGRLDKDTEGLLILTNDGELSHNLLSPKKHVMKKYLVHVDGEVTDDDVALFKNGVTIDKTVLLKSSVMEIISVEGEKSICHVSISEGKFHQVKKMFLAIDKKVTYLKRIAFSDFELPEDLECGSFRHMTEDELLLIKPKTHGEILKDE